MASITHTDNASQLLTFKRVLTEFFTISERTLESWISLGEFPKPDIQILGRSRLWKRSTVMAWIESRSVTPADAAQLETDIAKQRIEADALHLATFGEPVPTS